MWTQEHKDRRRHPRYPLHSCPLRVSWQDEHARFHQIPARGLDLSRSGICVEVPEPIELGAQVNLTVDRFALAETASVRYCHQVGPRHHVGLEFTVPLKWTHPELLSLEHKAVNV
jgi:hypothetical protein